MLYDKVNSGMNMGQLHFLWFKNQVVKKYVEILIKLPNENSIQELYLIITTIVFFTGQYDIAKAQSLYKAQESV